MTTTPAPGARDQVARLLMLVPYLHARGTVHVDEAARTLGTTPRQLVKDLKVLLMCGLPGGYPDDLIDVDLDALEEGGDGVIRVSNADYLARPLRLTPTEASAVIVALRALRNSTGTGSGTREVLDRALAKLQAAAAHGGVDQIDPGQGVEDAGVALLATRLQGAVDAGRQVRLRYFVPSRDEESERVVDPHRVVRAQAASTEGGRSAAYLDAWCHRAQAPRLFRLDRITDAEVLDTPVATTAPAPRDLEGGVLAEDETVLVTLRLAPQARWVVDYYPVLDVRPVPGDTREGSADGGVEVDLRVADERWLTRLLLRLAPYAEVLRPPEFAQTFTATVQSALSLYDEPDVD